MLDKLWAGLFRKREAIDAEQVRHAFVDGVTGLPTRYVMQMRLREARDAGVTGVVAMMDIDHFKQINDRNGKIVTARRELALVIVELQERNRALRDDARTDALTGLRNRLALDEVLDVVVGGSDPRYPAAAVAFVDIDHFGDYNHLHGDAAGDEALRRVAAAVRGCSRDADLVFRKGGEELVVVLAGATHDESRVAAERLRACVQALAIDHAGSKTASVLTVTVGLASGGAGGTLRALMIAASDEAMRAKVDHARNRVHAIAI